MTYRCLPNNFPTVVVPECTTDFRGFDRDTPSLVEVPKTYPLFLNLFSGPTIHSMMRLLARMQLVRSLPLC